MCGIFGHTEDDSCDLDLSRQALHTLEHRGPDSWGEWRDGEVYLGHRRLSIIDLSENANQPMVDSAETTIIAANGEIYNFKSLRESLLAGGYRFRSESDSEVILHGYREWGIDGLLDRIEGMFAFVVYDRENKKIFLARDRVGIKPLYYSRIGDELAWASELKALKVFHGSRLETDNTALYDFLTYSYIPTPKTCYRNVYKLQPAHYAEYDLDSRSIAVRRYWQLEINEAPLAVDEAAARFRELLEKSVKEQLVSDVPLGFFLSGGLDSSAIVAAAAASTDSISTFSIGFDDKSHDETKYAEIIAGLFATEHIKKILTVGTAAQLLDRMSAWYDEPFGDTSALPIYLVSKFARSNSTVALTGDGGDELFGGYRYYDRFTGLEHPAKAGQRYMLRAAQKLRKRFRLPLARKVCNRAIRRLSDEIELYLFIKGGMLREEKTAYRKRWGIDDDYDDYWYSRKYWRPDLPLKTRLQNLDFHTSLHDDMLTKVDRASMAVGLETRVPLLSTELIAFAFSLPESIRYHNGTLKGLMKYSFRTTFPDNIIDRKKKGFSIPVWGGEFAVRNKTRQEKLLELFGFAQETTGCTR